MERIIVQISRYLSEALAAEIARAQWHSDAPMWVNRLRRDIFDEDADGACFEVVARTAGGEAVGRLHASATGRTRRYGITATCSSCPPIGGAESPC